MVISSRVAINKYSVSRNNIAAPVPNDHAPLTPEALYTQLQCNYPKFFKMDKLCKWAVIAAEYLFSDAPFPEGISKSKTGLVVATQHGCIDVDKRYQDSIAVPSPALFVYTLPNIMLGEVCIRHGFKGEQLCMVSEYFDAQELYFAAQQQLMQQGMDACLCGWVDATGEAYDVHLFWILKKGEGISFSAAAMQELYNGARV